MAFEELSLPSELSALESVKEKFAHWRASRSKGNRMPKPLWESVKDLIKQYDYNHIASELKLNPHRLRTKIEKEFLKDSSFKDLPSPSAPDFIELCFPLLSPPQSKPDLEQKKDPLSFGTLELSRPDGTLLKASGLDYKDLFSLVQSFLGQ